MCNNTCHRHPPPFCPVTQPFLPMILEKSLPHFVQQYPPPPLSSLVTRSLAFLPMILEKSLTHFVQRYLLPPLSSLLTRTLPFLHMILEKSFPHFVQPYPPPFLSTLLTRTQPLPTYDSGEEFARLCAAIPAATQCCGAGADFFFGRSREPKPPFLRWLRLHLLGKQKRKALF